MIIHGVNTELFFILDFLITKTTFLQLRMLIHGISNNGISNLADGNQNCTVKCVLTLRKDTQDQYVPTVLFQPLCISGDVHKYAGTFKDCRV